MYQIKPQEIVIPQQKVALSSHAKNTILNTKFGYKKEEFNAPLFYYSINYFHVKKSYDFLPLLTFSQHFFH